MDFKGAWEGAKRVDNWLDPFDVAAAGAANAIEFLIPQTKEEMALELVTLGQGKKLALGGKLARIAGNKTYDAAKSLFIKPPNNPPTALATVATDLGTVIRQVSPGPKNGAKHLDELTQSNVLKMNAANPASHAHNLPPGFKGSESSKNRTAANKEIAGLRQDSDRATRAAASTNWLQSSLTRFNRKVGKSLDSIGRAIAEPHHVADHALVGDINLAIGEDRANILFKNLDAKDIRTGNDGYQMINIPGTKNLGPGSRNDHMKLIHKTWYPQIETRKILTDAIKDGTIKDKKIFSDKRIAGLLSSTIRQQQEITIGWAKWKLDKVRALYPETKSLKPQQMRDWLHDHPYKFSVAGAGEAPEHFSKITKYRATKGQGNYTNDYLRAVFGLEYNPRTLGRTHAIPLSDRQRAVQQLKDISIE